MAEQYWDPVAKDLDLAPIREQQLRDLLKKSTITLEGLQSLSFNYLLNLSHKRVISADKKVNREKEPQYYKAKG